MEVRIPISTQGDGKINFNDVSEAWGTAAMKGYFNGASYADRQRRQSRPGHQLPNAPAVVLKTRRRKEQHRYRIRWHRKMHRGIMPGPGSSRKENAIWTGDENLRFPVFPDPRLHFWSSIVCIISTACSCTARPEIPADQNHSGGGPYYRTNVKQGPFQLRPVLSCRQTLFSDVTPQAGLNWDTTRKMGFPTSTNNT